MDGHRGSRSAIAPFAAVGLSSSSPSDLRRASFHRNSQPREPPSEGLFAGPLTDSNRRPLPQTRGFARPCWR
jgi:hypothetical protein